MELNSELYLTESLKILYNFCAIKQVTFFTFTKNGEEPKIIRILTCRRQGNGEFWQFSQNWDNRNTSSMNELSEIAVKKMRGDNYA